MEYGNFYDIAEYGNVNWKGSFTPEEVRQNAEDYFTEWKYSNEQGKATHTMEELCKLLIEDGEEECEQFLDNILEEANWYCEIYYCQGCNKREIVFFSVEEMNNLWQYQNGNPKRMLIQDVLPNCSPMVREYERNYGLCLCEECWKKYWNMELTIK